MLKLYRLSLIVTVILRCCYIGDGKGGDCGSTCPPGFSEVGADRETESQDCHQHKPYPPPFRC